MIAGLMAATSSKPNPSLAIALNRIEWMKTSACLMSSRNAVLPASERRSRTTLRLPRFTLTKTPLMPGAGPTEIFRVLSPSGGSILITSAPMSAMIWVQYGPMTIEVRSTTRTPLSGPVPLLPMKCSFLGCASGHFEAVADVFVMAVGNNRKDQRPGGVTDRVDLFAHLLDRP